MWRTNLLQARENANTEEKDFPRRGRNPAGRFHGEPINILEIRRFRFLDTSGVCEHDEPAPHRETIETLYRKGIFTYAAGRAVRARRKRRGVSVLDSAPVRNCTSHDCIAEWFKLRTGCMVETGLLSLREQPPSSHVCSRTVRMALKGVWESSVAKFPDAGRRGGQDQPQVAPVSFTQAGHLGWSQSGEDTLSGEATEREID